MYSIQQVSSKPARYKVAICGVTFTYPMTKKDAQEYMEALENNTSIYGNWKGTNSRNQEYTQNHK